MSAVHVHDPAGLVAALRAAGYDATLPPLRRALSWSRPYRLWTAGYGIPFEAFPQYRDGGPAMVTLDGPKAWGVSCETSSGYSGPCPVMLRVSRINGRGPASTVERHPLYGTRYADHTAARRAAYDAGCLAFMAYEAGGAE